MKKQNKKYKKYIPYLYIFSLIILSGIGLFFINENKELKESNKNLTASLEEKTDELKEMNYKRTEVEIAKNQAEDKNNKLSLSLSVISDSTVAITQIVDRLDTLILSDDSQNRDFINWLIDNAQFNTSNGTYYAAINKKSNWDDYMELSDAEYINIKAEMSKIAQDLETQMTILEMMSKSTDTSES